MLPCSQRLAEARAEAEMRARLDAVLAQANEAYGMVQEMNS